MTIFWVAQGVGVVALIFSIFSYQSKSRDQLLGRQMAGAFVYMLHFALLSAWTGFAMNTLVALRNWIFGKKDTHAWAKSPAWLVLFIGLAIASLFFTWQGYISLLPVIGVILGIYSRWEGDVSHIRIFTIIGCILWIPYNLVVQSYTGVVTDIIVIGSVLYAIWKHDRNAPPSVDGL